MEPKIETYEIGLLLLLAILNRDSSYLLWILGVVGDRVSDNEQRQVWDLVRRATTEVEKAWIKQTLESYRSASCLE